MENIKDLLSLRELEKIFDIKKLILGLYSNVETLLLFETANSELIEQGFRYDIFEDDKISCYVDCPVSIDLRIGFFSVYRSKQCCDLLKPMLENVLLVFSETYNEPDTKSMLWDMLSSIMDTIKAMPKERI